MTRANCKAEPGGRQAAQLAGAALLAALGMPAFADWTVLSQTLDGAAASATIAHITNADGYTLEIYRDGRGAVRSRFSLGSGLTSFPDHACPTFQIDRGMPVNRSINDAACLSTPHWAEFVLGYVSDNRIISPRLLALMNGNTITFRFALTSGDYRTTEFSLAGSKRSMTEALGADITVSAR